MEKPYLESLISGRKDFLSDAKARILVIDEAIGILQDEKSKLEGIVNLYEPEQASPPEAEPIGLSSGPTQSEESNASKLEAADTSQKQSLGRGRSGDSTESRILAAFNQGKLVLAHHSQIAKEIGRETPDNNKNVRKALINLKNQKQLGLIMVKRSHPRTRHMLNTQLYGLTKIFNEPDGEELLSGYQVVKEKILSELGFSD